MLDDFLDLTNRYKVITDEVIKFISGGAYICTEDAIIEMTKLNVNCYITSDYLVKLLEEVSEDSRGVLKATPVQEANVVKCVRSIIESKKLLLTHGISLELH